MSNGMRAGRMMLIRSPAAWCDSRFFPTRAAADSTSAIGTITLTLPRAIEIALNRNRDVLMAGQDRQKARAQVSEAWSNALPRIDASGDYLRNVQLPVMFMPANSAFNPTNATQSIEIGSNNSYQLGASFAQPLYNRKVGVALDMAGTYEKYADQAFQATAEDVTRSTTKAFYRVMLAKELVEVNRQGLDVVKANLENVRSLYDHGNAAEYDLLRAEVQYANTEPLLITAQNNLELSMNSLKALLAIPLDQDLELEGAFQFEEIPPVEIETARLERHHPQSGIGADRASGIAGDPEHCGELRPITSPLSA